MSRKLLLLLPLALLLPLLTGCPAKAPVADGVVLTLSDAVPDLDRWQEVVDAFTEASKIKVSLQTLPQASYYAKLRSLMAGGSSPDLVCVDSTRFPELVAKGTLEKIDPFLQSQKDLRLSDYYSFAVRSYQYQGSTYGLPIDVSVLAIGYDVDQLELSMQPAPAEKWSWEQFAKLAGKLTRDTNDDGAVDLWGAAVGPWWQVSVWQNGAEIVDDAANPQRSTLNTPAAIAALQALADLTLKQKVAAPFVTTAAGGADLLAARHAALVCLDHSQIPRLNKTPDLRFGVMPLPTGKVAANLGLSQGLCLAKGAKRQEEALKLLAYLAGADGQKQLLASGSSTPALEALATSEYFEGGIGQASPFVQGLACARPLPATPRYTEIAAVWAEELAPLWRGQATAQQVCVKIDERVNKILAETKPATAWLLPLVPRG